MTEQELSNCCKAQVTVDSADEGTSCYVCIKCNKPCDLFENNKEQVSVDMGIGESNTVEGVYLPISEYERLKQENEVYKYQIEELNKIIERGKDEYFIMTRNFSDKFEYSCKLFEENKRLKRLDENVKKKIKHFEHPDNWSINNLSTVDVILLLKRLYDETTQES
jgi:hypothetical protein